MNAGPRNGVYRRMPSPLAAERALRGPQNDRLAGQRLLGADDERARLDRLDQARATLLSGWSESALIALS